jgi:glycosyltransferase involved in cell wall biosynthesis
MRQSDHTVMVSRATRRQFATALDVDESLFTVVPNGIAPATGDPTRVRAEFGIDEQDCVLLAVGTLERHKGHQVLLEALSRLESAALPTRWKLIVAGGRGGDQHQPILDYIREKGWGDRVHVVLNRNDVADLLALADVFVMPSLWEGLPMALLEAMLAGKAIIASATAGIPEAIVSGRDGILVPPTDVAALSDALRLLLTEPARRAVLADAAAERAKRDFTVGVMAEKYQALYTSVGNKGHRRTFWAQADTLMKAADSKSGNDWGPAR